MTYHQDEADGLGRDKVSTLDAIKDLVKNSNTAMTGSHANGIHIVTFTFSENDPGLDSTKTLYKNTASFAERSDLNATERERRSLLRDGSKKWMKRIEEVANIRFVELRDSDAKNADIRFLQANFEADDMAEGRAIIWHRKTDILISRDLPDYRLPEGMSGHKILGHEILHSLGLRHPGKDGPDDAADPRYSDKGTLMSMNPKNPTPRKLGRYDIAALQYL